MHIVELPRRGSEVNGVRILNSTFLDSIESEIRPERGNVNNDFRKAFEIIENKFSNRKYTVLLISDGAFNDPRNTGNRSEVRSWLEEHRQLEGHHQFLKNLYMLLWNCPPDNYDGYESDKYMWMHYLTDHRSAQVRLLEIKPNDDNRDLGAFLQNMIENTSLGNALPKGKYNGWLSSDELSRIPGYTSTITLSVWLLSTSTEEDVQANLHIGNNKYTLNISNSTFLEGEEKYVVPPPNPEDGCIPRSPRLLFNREISLGYYVLEPHFVHADLKLQQVIIITDDNLDYEDIYTNTGVYTIWNSPNVSVELTGLYIVDGGTDKSTLDKYRPCYSFHVVASFSDTSGMFIKEERTRFNEMQIWVSPYTISNIIKSESFPKEEGYISFIFQIQALDQTVSEWTGNKPVGVRFHPIVKMEEQQKIQDNEKEIIEIPLSLSREDFYDKLKAYVYVPDNKSSEECTTGNPKEDFKVFGYPKKISAIQVEDSQGRGKIPTNLLLIEKDGGKISLIINDFDKVVERCGYRYLIMNWDDNMPFYACDVKERQCDRADRLLSRLN